MQGKKGFHTNCVWSILLLGVLTPLYFSIFEGLYRSSGFLTMPVLLYFFPSHQCFYWVAKWWNHNIKEIIKINKIKCIAFSLLRQRVFCETQATFPRHGVQFQSPMAYHLTVFPPSLFQFLHHGLRVINTERSHHWDENVLALNARDLATFQLKINALFSV